MRKSGSILLEISAAVPAMKGSCVPFAHIWTQGKGRRKHEICQSTGSEKRCYGVGDRKTGIYRRYCTERLFGSQGAAQSICTCGDSGNPERNGRKDAGDCLCTDLCGCTPAQIYHGRADISGAKSIRPPDFRQAGAVGRGCGCNCGRRR